jgi:hypothetical protein
MALDQQTVSALLEYDPISGLLRWKINRYRVHKGDTAGWINPTTRHRQIRIDQKTYLAHQVIWLWMTGEFPTFDIDHKDTVGSNNAWTNLRRATKSLNGANRKKNKNNTSGFKGVSRARKSKRWRDARARSRADGGHAAAPGVPRERAPLSHP